MSSLEKKDFYYAGDGNDMLPYISTDVLEHLIDPWNILKTIRNKLSPNGKVIVSIPNFRYVTNLFNIFVKKDWVYEDAGILDATNIHFFPRKSIERLFLQNEYIIQSIKGITKTSSVRGLMLATFINLLSFGYHRDIYFKQYVVIATRESK